MEQMTLFDSERSYKYIMDTSSILSQKPGETHTRLVYKSQWERIEEYMRSHSIVTCSEIFETSLDKGTQRKTTENELPSLTQCTA